MQGSFLCLQGSALWNISQHSGLYSEEFLATSPTPKMEDHPLSAVEAVYLLYSKVTLHIRRPWR